MRKYLFWIALLWLLLVLVAQGTSPSAAQGPTSKRPLPREVLRNSRERTSVPVGVPAGVPSGRGYGSGGAMTDMRGIAQVPVSVNDQEISAEHQIGAADYAAAKRAAENSIAPRSTSLSNNDLSRVTEQPASPRAPIFSGASYRAITYTGFTPANPIVVPTQTDVLAVVNRTFYVFDKGSPPHVIGKSDLGTWFSGSFTWSPGTVFFDTKVVYRYDIADTSKERVYLVALAKNTTTTPKQSWIIVFASLQNNAGYAWYPYRFDATLDGTTATSNYADSLSIGVDDLNLYISTNQYGFDGSGFKYSKVRMLKLSDLQLGTPGPVYFDFTSIQHNDGSQAFTVVPASHYFTSAPIHLVSSENSLTATTGNVVSLFRIDLPTDNNWPTNPPNLVRVNSMTTTNTFGNPPDAEQMGSTTRIDTGDDRILSARRYAGDIWAVVSTSRPDGYAGLTVFKILTSGTIAWESAGWGAEGCYYYYPAIAVDDWENIGLVFSRSCDDGYVGIRHTGMKIGESALEPSKLIKLGEAPYVNLDSGGVNRWGGYSGIERDPFDLFTFWMFDAYATARVGTGNNSGRWATWMYTAWYPPYSYYLPIVGRGY